MPYSCPNCGSPMTYESGTRMFLCKSCGLYVSYEQLMALLDEKKQKEKSDYKKEYLEWWSSSKKG